jgi:hypothetical protein
LRASGRQKIRQLFHGRGTSFGEDGLTRWLPSLSDSLIIGNLGAKLDGVCGRRVRARISGRRHTWPKLAWPSPSKVTFLNPEPHGRLPAEVSADAQGRLRRWEEITRSDLR